MQLSDEDRKRVWAFEEARMDYRRKRFTGTLARWTVVLTFWYALVNWKPWLATAMAFIYLVLRKH